MDLRKDVVEGRKAVNSAVKDEPMNDQPVQQIEHREAEAIGPAPSRELLELQQQLAKKEHMFQRACRAAREAELRAERAENLLDSKESVLRTNTAKELLLERRVTEVSEQLEEAKRTAEIATNRARELERENEELKRENGMRGAASNRMNDGSSANPAIDGGLNDRRGEEAIDEPMDEDHASTSSRRPTRRSKPVRFNAERPVKKTNESYAEGMRASVAAYGSPGYGCDGCEVWLTPGTGRFKCDVCPDYDACAECVMDGLHKDASGHTLSPL